MLTFLGWHRKITSIKSRRGFDTTCNSAREDKQNITGSVELSRFPGWWNLTTRTCRLEVSSNHVRQQHWRREAELDRELRVAFEVSGRRPHQWKAGDVWLPRKATSILTERMRLWTKPRGAFAGWCNKTSRLERKRLKITYTTSTPMKSKKNGPKNRVHC